MVKYETDINFDKYHTFFLEYYKDDGFSMHSVRPCAATYTDIISRKHFSYTIDGAVLVFEHNTSLAEILIECTIRGISLDFISIKIKNDDKSLYASSHKIIEEIDTHKTDILKHLDAIEAPKFYVVDAKNKNVALRWLVINRFLQKQDIKFLNGEYEECAVIAGFKSSSDAINYCKKLNESN